MNKNLPFFFLMLALWLGLLQLAVIHAFSLVGTGAPWIEWCRAVLYVCGALYFLLRGENSNFCRGCSPWDWID